MGSRKIAGGAWTQLLLNGQPVGLASGATYDEDWGINPAKTLNYLGPLDYNSLDYVCRITIATYVPEIPGSGPWPDGGIKALSDYLPTRSQIQNAGVTKPNEFDILQFINTSTGEEMNRFRSVIIASNGAQIAPGSYITANMSLLAIERMK